MNKCTFSKEVVEPLRADHEVVGMFMTRMTVDPSCVAEPTPRSHRHACYGLQRCGLHAELYQSHQPGKDLTQRLLKRLG